MLVINLVADVFSLVHKRIKLSPTCWLCMRNNVGCGNCATSCSLLVEDKNGKLYIKFGLLLFNANVAKNFDFLKHFTHSWFWQWQSLTMDSFIRWISLHGCWRTRSRLEKSIYIYIWIFFLGKKEKRNKNLNYRRWTSNHVFGMQLLLYKLFWPHGEGYKQKLSNMCGCKLDRTRWLDKTNTPSPVRTSNFLTLEVLTGFAGWRSYRFRMCDLSTLLHHKKLQGRPHQVRKRQGKQYNLVLGKVIWNHAQHKLTD